MLHQNTRFSQIGQCGALHCHMKPTIGLQQSPLKLGVCGVPMISRQQRSRRQSSIVARAGPAPAGKVNVSVLGASGGIGQPLSMLLKMSPHVGNLSLFDIKMTPGVAADLSHIDTAAKTTGYVGQEQITDALEGAQLVIIPAGVPRKPGMSRDDLFNINASIVQGLIDACADNCPDAVIGIISNPVNSTVPIAAEVMKAKGKYNKNKILGITTLDLVRANTFWAEYCGVEPKEARVPVVGGHAGVTIMPLLSQATPVKDADEETLKALTKRIQEAGTEVVEAKAGAGSATLSMAYAAVRFADSCMRAILGEDGVVECAYMETSTIDGLDYFSVPVKLGKDGVVEELALGQLSALELANLEELKGPLATQIKKGVDFVTSS